MFSALLQNIEKAHRPPRLHCPITKGKATLSGGFLHYFFFLTPPTMIYTTEHTASRNG